MVPASPHRRTLLIAILALFNESDDIDVTLGVTLAMLTAALDGRIGEIWLRDGDARNVELHYSSSDGAGRCRGIRGARAGRSASGPDPRW